MNKIDYFDLGMDDNLPEFDKSYKLVYQTDGGIDSRLEILGKDSIIMQTGIQIIFPHSFFSKSKNHYKTLKSHSENYYGECLPINISGTKFLNYGNALSVCYLSKMKINCRDVINFKVGNRKFW